MTALELGGVALRWIALSCTLALPGLLTWRLQALGSRAANRLLPLCALAWLSTLLLLAHGRATATGHLSDLLQPASWFAFGSDTRAGQLLLWRVSSLSLVGALLAMPSRLRRRSWASALVLIASGAAVLGMSFGSHASPDEPLWVRIAHGVHLLAAALWFGGLWGVRALAGEDPRVGEVALRRFSSFALALMGLVLAAGFTLAFRYIDPAYASLVATPYGVALLVKLACLIGILGIAAHLRWHVLPLLAATPLPALRAEDLLGLRREFGLALLLLLAAAWLGSSIPGNHADIPHWPWPFRFSPAASAQEAGALPQALVGLALAVMGLALMRRQRRPGFALLALGMATGLHAIAVPASPDTYRFPTVAFDATSVAQGAAHFAQHCGSCHGPQGKGDGPLAKTTPVAPVDLLTEPHTARHTVGDFFHWIGAGIEGRGMPGFAGVLDEDARWDLVHFLHLVTRGYEARLLRPTIVPRRPEARLGALDFAWSTRNGEVGVLHESQRVEAVLLVFTSRDASNARLAQLAAVDWHTLGARLLVVPLDGKPTGLPQEVLEEAPAIATSYLQFRRTLSHPDLLGAPTMPSHMELLVDRFGYLRARWIPEIDGTGWEDLQALQAQLRALQAEPEILPPPSPHAH